MKKSFKKIISTVLLIAMLIPSLSTNAFAVSIDTIIGRETEKFEERNKDIRSKYFEELQDATKLLMKGDDDLNDVEIDDGEIEENKGEVFGDAVFNMSGFMYSILPPEYVTIRQSVYKHWDNYPDQILKVYTIKPEAQWMDEIVEYVKKQTGSEKVYVAKDVLENYDIDEKFVYPYPTIPKSKFPNANEELMVNLTARAAYEEDTGKKIQWCDDNKFPYATPLHLANAGFFTTTEDDGKTYIHFIQNTTQGLSRRLQYERLATELWQVKFDLSVISNYWEKATINSRVKLSKDIIFRQDGYNTAPKAHVIKPKKAADFYKALGLNKAEIKSINLGWGSDHRPKDSYEIINYYSDLEVEGNWESAGNSASKLDPVEGNGVNAALLYTESLNKFDVYLFGMYNYWRLDGSSYGIYWDLSDIKEEIKEDTGLDITKHYADVTWVTGDNVTWTNTKAKFDQYELGTEHPLPTNNDLKRTNKEGYELCGWYINNDDKTLYTSIPATQTGNITLTASWRRLIKIPKELIYREDGFNTAPKAHVIKPKQAKDFYSVLGLNKEEINSINLGWDSNHRPKYAYEIIDYYSDLEVEGDWQGQGRTETKLDPVEANGVNAALLYNEASKKYDVYLFGMYALWSLDGKSYGIYWDLSDVEEEIKTDTGIDITKHYGQVTWVIGDNATWANERAKFDQYELATSHPLPTNEDITKKGYVLDGWFINNDKNTKYTSIPATQTGNITLTANWITKFINIPKEMISAGGGKININLDKNSWKSQLGLDNYYDIVKITDEPFDTTGLTLVDTIWYQSKDYKQKDVRDQMSILLASNHGTTVKNIVCVIDGMRYLFYDQNVDYLNLVEEPYDFLVNKDFNAKVYEDDKGSHYVLLNQQKEIKIPSNWSFTHYYNGGKLGMPFYLRWNFGNINIPQYVDIPKKLIGRKQGKFNILITPEKDSWKTQLGLDKYDNIIKVTDEELNEEGLTLVETIRYKSSEYRGLVAQKDIAEEIANDYSYVTADQVLAKNENEELPLLTSKVYPNGYDFLISYGFYAEVYKDNKGNHFVKLNDRKKLAWPPRHWFAVPKYNLDPINDMSCWFAWDLGNITPNNDTRLKVGDRVVFGTKKNELHWTVIDKKDDKVLLLYVDPPEGGLFGDENQLGHYYMRTYWRESYERQRLNSELYNNYFTEVEKAQILKTHLSTVDPADATSKFETEDKIFALSLDEYNTYKSVIPQFLFDGERDTGSFNRWGLRTRGHDTSNPNNVYNYVVRGTSGTAYVDADAYYRPAMWVDFDGIVAVNDTEKEATNKIKLPKEIIFREDGFNTAARAHVIRPKKAADFYGVLGLEKDKIGSINLGWDSDHRPITAYKIIDYYSDLQVEGYWTCGKRSETTLDPVEVNGVNAVLFHNDTNDKYDVYLFGMYALWSLDGRSYGIYWDLSDVIDEVKTDTGIDLSSKYGDVTWVEGDGATWTNTNAKFEHYELGTTRALPTKDDIKRDKYELDGWFINEDKNTKHTFIPKAQTGNITLTANWKATEQPTSSEEASTTKESTTKEETTASPSDATEESTKIEDATSKADESSKESSSEESSKESTKEGEQSSEQESTSQTVAEEETTSEEETTKDSGNKKTATDSEIDESTTESTNEGGNTQGGGVAPSENVDPITYSLFWDWTTKVEWNFTKAYEDNNDTNSYVYGIDYILPLKSEITVLTDGYEFESWTISGDYLEETENATKIPAGTTGGIILKPIFSHEEVPHTKYTMPNTWYERFGFSENKENIKEIHFVDSLDDITNIKEQKVIDDTTPTTDPTVAPTQATTQATTEEGPIVVTDESVVGEEITFGKLPDGSPLHWTVIDKEDNKVMLLFKYMGHHIFGDDSWVQTYNMDTDWEHSKERNKLNTTFYNNYFTAEERDKILTTHLTNKPNIIDGTGGGNDTDDKIFALSYDEYYKYQVFTSEWTEIVNGTWGYGLRTNGKRGFLALRPYIDTLYTLFMVYGTFSGGTCYRPAMWVDISVLNEKNIDNLVISNSIESDEMTNEPSGEKAYVDIPKKLISRKDYKINITLDKDSWKTQLGLGKYNNIVKITDGTLSANGLTFVERIKYQSTEYKTLTAQKDIAGAIVYCHWTDENLIIASNKDGKEVSLINSAVYDESYDFLKDLNFYADVYKDSSDKYYVKMNQKRVIKDPDGWVLRFTERNGRTDVGAYMYNATPIFLCWGLGNINASNNSSLMAPKSNDSEVYAFTGTETATNETVNKTYAKAIITNDNILYVAPGENVDLTIDGNASNFFGHTYKGKFTNATVIDGLDKLDFSNTTNMHNFFAYCEKLKSVDVSSLNTSKVTDMSQMFFDCKTITSLDLSTLDTKKVENMTEMFKNMSSLITIYVSKDDMDKSALTNSKDMFLNDTKLVGGEGTVYDSNVVDKTYANIDRKNTNGTKGYFTVKGNEPYTPPVTEDASYDIIWDLQGATFKDEYKSIYENAKHTTKEDYILPGEEVLNIPYANIFKNWTVDGVATTSISKNIHKAVTVTANVVRAVSSYETYSIGTYKQESNEPSNIEWVVLEKKDGKLLLTTKNIIDNKSYDEQGKSNFTQSSIKQWLNDDFYKDAFTKEQQDKILDTTLSGNQKAKVFLLTEDEVSAYYPEDVLRIARATNYAMQADNDGEKLSTRNNNIAGYWLMTSENTEDTPYVSNTGKIVETGEKADANHIGVRPCIWVTEKEVKEIRVLSFGNFMKEIGKQIDTFFRFMGFFSNGNKKGK